MIQKLTTDLVEQIFGREGMKDYKLQIEADRALREKLKDRVTYESAKLDSEKKYGRQGYK